MANYIQTRKEIIPAYLFGSMVKREKGPVQYIDIAVLVSPDRLKTLDQTEPYGYRARLIAEIAGRLGTDKSDANLFDILAAVVFPRDCHPC